METPSKFSKEHDEAQKWNQLVVDLANIVDVKNFQLKEIERSMVEEKNRLSQSLSSMVEEKNSLSQSLSSMVEEKNKLSQSLSNMVEEKNKLSQSLSSMVEEKNELSQSLSSTVEEKNKLSQSLSSTVEEKNELSQSLSSTVEEKNKLSQSLSCMVVENTKLSQYCSCIVEERRQMWNIVHENGKLKFELESLRQELKQRGKDLENFGSQNIIKMKKMNVDQKKNIWYLWCYCCAVEEAWKELLQAGMERLFSSSFFLLPKLKSASSIRADNDLGWKKMSILPSDVVYSYKCKEGWKNIHCQNIHTACNLGHIQTTVMQLHCAQSVTSCGEMEKQENRKLRIMKRKLQVLERKGGYSDFKVQKKVDGGNDDCKIQKKRDGVNQEQAEKDEEIENLESLNQVLIVKAQTSNNELQEARKELINGFQGLSSARSLIGIKRLGELNAKPFRNACQQRFSSGEAEIKSVELSSLWQNHINDPQWHPFKFANIDGKLLETIDDGDARVKELKDVWGDEVYKAVTTALLELNDCNPSGRYAVQELWNFKENRKASLKEGIHYILNQLKIHKRRK